MTKLFLPRHLAQSMQQKSEALKKASGELQQSNKIEDNAEYQRRKMMSRDQKYIDAIERLVYSRKQYNDAMTGRDTTLEQARKEMMPIIQKYARDKGIE